MTPLPVGAGGPVLGCEGGRAPQQPDFAVWLQERHCAELNGSERGRGPPIRARFVVLTTILQSRITPPSAARYITKRYHVKRYYVKGIMKNLEPKGIAKQKVL